MNISSMSGANGSSPAISSKTGGKESLSAPKKSLDIEKSDAEGVIKMSDAASSVSGSGTRDGVGVMFNVTA
jgi:hypothetical protein